MIPTAFDAVYASIFLRFLRRTYRKLSPGSDGGYAVVLGYEGIPYIVGRFHTAPKAKRLARLIHAKTGMASSVYNPTETEMVISNHRDDIRSIFDADMMNNKVLAEVCKVAANESQTIKSTQPF